MVRWFDGSIIKSYGLWHCDIVTFLIWRRLFFLKNGEVYFLSQGFLYFIFSYTSK